jgi:hypothetical protein
MASFLSHACRRSISEWKAAQTALADAVQIYLDACLSLDTSYAKESGLEQKDVEEIQSVYKTLEDAIPTLLSHEDSLRTAPTHLQRRRSASVILLPINKLSPDLLSQIFTLVVESTRVCNDDVRTHQTASVDMANVLSSVCAHWRHIALSTGTIWSYVDLSKLGSFKHAAIWISRAEGCLLDLHAVPKGPFHNQHLAVPKRDDKAISLSNLLYPARVRSIVLRIENKLLDPWLSWWFEHGAPGTVTTLALQAVDRLSFPVTLEEPAQKRMDELLFSVDTIFLSNRCRLGQPHISRFNCPPLGLTTKLAHATSRTNPIS